MTVESFRFTDINNDTTVLKVTHLYRKREWYVCCIFQGHNWNNWDTESGKLHIIIGYFLEFFFHCRHYSVILRNSDMTVTAQFAKPQKFFKKLLLCHGFPQLSKTGWAKSQSLGPDQLNYICGFALISSVGLSHIQCWELSAIPLCGKQNVISSD